MSSEEFAKRSGQIFYISWGKFFGDEFSQNFYGGL